MEMRNELELSISSVRVGEWSYILTVAGELDLYSAGKLRDALDAVPRSVRTVAVDLTGSGFVDSVGIATLLGAARELASHGGRMLLVADDRLQRLLHVTGIARYFELFTTHDDAVRHVAGASVLESLRR